METKETTMVVPPQFACPVCGKWGRSNHTNRDVPFGYLFCNPKARTGGKGCGEVFKHLRVPQCTRIQIPIEISKADKLERIRLMGFKMVQAMKDAGAHNGFQRTCTWNYVYRHISESDGNCDCGCGNPKQPPRGRFASSVCAEVVFSTAQMIATQGSALRGFMIDLRGANCECCKKDTKSLDVDHVLEVNEGGGLCWIDNFQLLCSKCHKQKTAEYAAKRALRARIIKEDAQKQQTGQLELF